MVNPELVENLEQIAADAGIGIIGHDFERPWGGFILLDEANVETFARRFFPDEQIEVDGRKLSPKFLLVAPESRLSWQYHHRRSEIWQVLDGPVGVVVSETDQEGDTRILKEGETIRIAQGQRHRLMGLDNWGVVAEIWMHTDPEQPSDESDIVRVEDDFGRS